MLLGTKECVGESLTFHIEHSVNCLLRTVVPAYVGLDKMVLKSIQNEQWMKHIKYLIICLLKGEGLEVIVLYVLNGSSQIVCAPNA